MAISSDKRVKYGGGAGNKFLLRRLVISEKAVAAAERGTYTFIVAREATKPAVRTAVKAAYGVDAVAVRISNAKPKERRLGRSVGVKPGYKKAVVQLKTGQKIEGMPQ